MVNRNENHSQHQKPLPQNQYPHKKYVIQKTPTTKSIPTQPTQLFKNPYHKINTHTKNMLFKKPYHKNNTHTKNMLFKNPTYHKINTHTTYSTIQNPYHKNNTHTPNMVKTLRNPKKKKKNFHQPTQTLLE